jgi:hypothetical protein
MAEIATWQPPEVAGATSAGTTAADNWVPPEVATNAPTPGRVFASPNSVMRTDPDAHWRSLYGGLDGLDRRLDPQQAAAFGSLDKISRDPKEDRARAINQTFIGEKLKMPPEALHSNWDAVKSAFAKSELSIDQDKIPDKSLYGWIGQRLNPPEDKIPDKGEVKAWTWRDRLGGDLYAVKREAERLWSSIFKPFTELPSAPADLPDVWIPGGVSGIPTNPAVLGGVYNGAIKPLIESLESPGGIATLALPALRTGGTATKVAFKGISGLFAGLMGWGTYESGKELARLRSDPNSTTQEQVAALSSAVSNGAMTLLGALGTAFDKIPERADKVAASMEGKPMAEAAEVLRREAVPLAPEQADALNQAAAKIDEVAAKVPTPIGAGLEQTATGEVRPIAQEKIAAAAVRASDGTVSEGQSHAEIKTELTGEEVPEGEKPLEGSTEGFVTTTGRFVNRSEASAIAADAGQLKPDVAEKPPTELRSHEVEYAEPRSSFGQTSLKNAYGELERDAYGFDEATPTEKRSMAERWARSKEVLNQNPKAGEQLAARLLADPNIGLTDDQSALLLRHKVDLQRALNTAADAAADPNASPVLKAEAQAQVKDLSDQLVKLLDAVKNRGSEWGREGRWRQALAREDYSFASQETLLRAAKGGAELTEAERQGLMDRIAALEKKQAQWDARQARTTESPNQAADRAVRAMERPPAGAPRRVKLAESIREKLHAKAAESRKFLAGKVLSPTPEDLYHMAVIGADQIYSVGLDFAKWSAAMVGELGEKVRPLLSQIWESAQKQFHSENRAGLVADLAALGSEDRIKRLSGIAQELARSHIAQGVKGRDAVLDAVFADVHKAMPEATRSEVRDAISGYGQFKPLTHDQISDQLRDIKGQLQQIAKLEDMEEGRAPKKTGVERKIPSDEERRLQQQVEAKKKEGGYVKTDPERQLKTALEAVKTRLTNQIKDLETQIETRTKIVKERKGVIYDDEADRLRARRDELKKEFEQVFGRKELSDQQRLNIWKASAQRRVAEYQRRLAEREFEPPAKRPPPPMDAEGIRIKADLERIKQDFAIERAKAEEAALPAWQRRLRTTADLARASALSGYHTLAKLASYSLARFAEKPVVEAVGAALRRIPGVDVVAAKANLEAGAEFEGLAKFYAKAATDGIRDGWETITTGKSSLKAELADFRENVQPVRWWDYFGLSHMSEKSPLLRGEFELRLEKNHQWAIANGFDVTDGLVEAALRKDAFDYAQHEILQEKNVFSEWINTLHNRLEAANPKTGKADVTKAALSAFARTFLTKGIVKTPANYVMQTLKRTPLGLAKGTAQLFVAHRQGVAALTPEEANAIFRLLKLGAVGSAVFVWGAIDASKSPKDRIFGGYYQPGDKRGSDDVGFGRIRIDGWEMPHLLTHNPLTESGQMGSTFYRVMKSTLTKLGKKPKRERGATSDAEDMASAAAAGAAASIVAVASEAPIVSPITREVQDVERGEANKLIWDELAGLVPMLASNLAQDLDSGKSRKPESLGQAIEMNIPGLRGNVPETKAQKEKDRLDKLKQSRNVDTTNK